MAAAAGAHLLGAGDGEGLVDGDDHVGAVGGDDVGLVDALAVGLDALDGGTGVLRERGGRDLVGRVAGEQRLVAALRTSTGRRAVAGAGRGAGGRPRSDGVGVLVGGVGAHRAGDDRRRRRGPRPRALRRCPNVGPRRVVSVWVSWSIMVGSFVGVLGPGRIPVRGGRRPGASTSSHTLPTGPVKGGAGAVRRLSGRSVPEHPSTSGTLVRCDRDRAATPGGAARAALAACASRWVARRSWSCSSLLVVVPLLTVGCGSCRPRRHDDRTPDRRGRRARRGAVLGPARARCSRRGSATPATLLRRRRRAAHRHRRRQAARRHHHRGRRPASGWLVDAGVPAPRRSRPCRSAATRCRASTAVGRAHGRARLDLAPRSSPTPRTRRAASRWPAPSASTPTARPPQPATARASRSTTSLRETGGLLWFWLVERRDVDPVVGV